MSTKLAEEPILDTPDNSFFAGFYYFTPDNIRAGNGSCGVADR